MKQRNFQPMDTLQCYTIFEFTIFYLMTETTVQVTIERKLNSGTLGEVEVFYRTLNPVELYPHLPGGYLRADWLDYYNQSGFVLFGVGQMSAVFSVTIQDDAIPEIEETLFVILTGAELTGDKSNQQEGTSKC